MIPKTATKKTIVRHSTKAALVFFSCLAGEAVARTESDILEQFVKAHGTSFVLFEKLIPESRFYLIEPGPKIRSLELETRALPQKKDIESLEKMLENGWARNNK